MSNYNEKELICTEAEYEKVLAERTKLQEELDRLTKKKIQDKNVPLWILDTNTVTVTHFNSDTLTVESKTYSTDFIRYHLHYSDGKCPDRLRKLVNEGKIIQYLDDLELKVSEAITRQVELWSRPIVAIRKLSLAVILRRCSVLYVC